MTPEQFCDKARAIFDVIGGLGNRTSIFIGDGDTPIDIRAGYVRDQLHKKLEEKRMHVRPYWPARSDTKRHVYIGGDNSLRPSILVDCKTEEEALIKASDIVFMGGE